MDRNARHISPDAQLNLAWWLDHLDGAPDVAAVMQTVQGFVAAWPTAKIEKFAVQHRPGRLQTPDDVAAYAHSLVVALISGLGPGPEINAMSMFFSQASARLSSLLAADQLANASSRLFFNK